MSKHVPRSIGVLVFVLFASAIAAAQVDSDRIKRADTNNAVIEGRVTLPSGFAAERSIRITLRNTQMIISTRYTNKHGEFRFDNLSEGSYYVEADSGDDGVEPVVKQVGLGRGIVMQLTLQLNAKGLQFAYTSARVVSVAELRQVVPAAAKKQYELGLKAVAKGDVTTAASRFEAALTIYPEYLAARNDLGAQYLKLKRIDEAEKHFQTVIEKDPKNFNAQFNLGLVRVERKAYADAISELNKSIVIDSTRPVARLWLGFALLESGDLGNAERELTKALVMGGAQCVAAHYHLARIYFARGDNDEAVRALHAYLDEAPKGEYAADAKQLEKQIRTQP